MASITLNYADGLNTRIIAAFVAAYESKRQSGETDGQLTIRMIKEYVKNVVVAYESVDAGKVAHDAQHTTSESEIVIT